MKFSDLKFEPMYPTKPELAGIYSRHFFPNGYGVSVIKTQYSYGNKQGLYEIAILRGTDASWKITYDTGISDDVIGYLNESGVEDIINQVQSLSPDNL